MSNELAKLKELAQTQDLLIANGQLTTYLLRQLADNEIDSDCFAVVSECESYGKETDAELSITDFALRAACHVDALIERLEAAEAQVKELTADLDKESEIRHRIHEELNAIKGEQKPIGYIDPASLREYRGVKAGGSWSALPKTGEYNQATPIYIHPAPAVLPPEIVRDDADGYWLYKGERVSSANAAYYNQALRDAKALGAKPLPTIVLTAGVLKPDGRIWYTSETVEALIRAAGLEVKL